MTEILLRQTIQPETRKSESISHKAKTIKSVSGNGLNFLLEGPGSRFSFYNYFLGVKIGPKHVLNKTCFKQDLVFLKF